MPKRQLDENEKKAINSALPALIAEKKRLEIEKKIFEFKLETELPYNVDKEQKRFQEQLEHTKKMIETCSFKIETLQDQLENGVEVKEKEENKNG